MTHIAEKGWGYWDVTLYPYGGCFRRLIFWRGGGVAMTKRKQYNRIDPTRTWKHNYQELAESCDKARAYCDLLRTVLYDSETSGLTFVCRTDGQYASDFGSMWYVARNGTVVEINHENHEAHTFANWAEVLALYGTFQAAHNVAAYQRLSAVAQPSEVTI